MKQNGIPLLAIALCLVTLSAFFWQCKGTKTTPLYPSKAIQLQPEKAAKLAQQIR